MEKPSGKIEVVGSQGVLMTTQKGIVGVYMIRFMSGVIRTAYLNSLIPLPFRIFTGVIA
jgi:hypothetical protein